MRIPRKTLLWSAAGIAALGLIAWAFAPRPVPVETATVQVDRFEQAIEEDGRTRLKDRYLVSTPVAARVARIPLREGDRVAAGDTVAVLLPVMSSMVDERSAREADAAHRAAAAAVQRAAAREGRARVAREEARLDLQRTEALAGRGFVSGARLDSVRLALSAAQREVDAATADRAVAVQEQARAAAALLPADPARTEQPLPVRAPVDGVVLKVAQVSEATLPAGSALLEIGDPRQLEVVAELLTTDAIQARPGRPVVIERWGGPPVQGRVRRVEPAAFTKVSALGVEEQRVRVLIELDEAPEAWQLVGDGFRVTARIVTEGVADALLVPVGAIFPFADGGIAVFRVDADHRARLQPVEMAGRNASHARILQGLSPGQQVIVYPPATVEPGQRVQPRQP